MDRNSTNNSQEVAAGFYSPSEEQIVLLQSILQKESHESVSLKEAQEVGIQLVSLYECLARDRTPPIGVRGNDES
ncbi:MAG: hypothetical protein UY35_C0001G0012 [Candidatus Saccharibacteria bacterium GW2011_GWC2_48_9]|jgi:hypothetical protein|nr:MAG: hypothetical protein UY35_C0001G0012 [Candidatus Saccharibacteria bacterium GW2011_GWC2_48_9]QQS69522.1 MAG: hypothetical protein IPP75_06485 [Candidatus Saccharibacteria bacterium]HCH34386.1 hypothetical protein [Candidatus Saccharibacteria bacterium]